MPHFDPQFMAALLVCIAALLFILKLWRDVFGPGQKTTIMNEPVSVTLAKEFTPIERTAKLEEESRRGFTDLSAQIAKTDEERRQSVGRVYSELRSSIKELRSELKIDNETLRAEIREDVRGIHDLHRDTLKAISRLEGAVENRREAGGEP